MRARKIARSKARLKSRWLVNLQPAAFGVADPQPLHRRSLLLRLVLAGASRGSRRPGARLGWARRHPKPGGSGLGPDQRADFISAEG